MTILCNRTRSNFLNCKTMENQKLKFSLAHSLASSLSLARSLANRTSHLVKLSLPDILETCLHQSVKRIVVMHERLLMDQHHIINNIFGEK